MPSRAPRLAINEKDADAARFTEDDPRRDWVAGNPQNPRNAHPGVTANMKDKGFNHLQLNIHPLIFSPPIEPPDFQNFDNAKTATYIELMRQKLTLTKTYITQEKAIGLDPHRGGAYRDPTALLLAKEPIRIMLQAQNLVRLLLESAHEIKWLMEVGQADEVEDEVMQDYWMFWTTLRTTLAWQFPGRSEQEKVDRAGKVMAGVLDELVHPDED